MRSKKLKRKEQLGTVEQKRRETHAKCGKKFGTRNDCLSSSAGETTYLLKNEAMRQRLLKAKNWKKGIPLEAAIEKLGI